MIDQIIDSMRDQDLARRLRSVLERARSSSSNQPSDRVDLSPSGHLRFELYNEDGETVDVIEQQNMVTDHALEMLTEIFASDLSVSLQAPDENEDAVGYEFRVTSPTNLNTLHLVQADNPRTLYEHRIMSSNSSLLRFEYHHDEEPRHAVGQRSEIRPLFPPVYRWGSMIRHVGIGDGLSNEMDISNPGISFAGTWTIIEDPDSRFGSRAVTDIEDNSVTIHFTGTHLLGIFTTMENGADIEVSMPNNPAFQTKVISLYSESTNRQEVIELASDLDYDEHMLVIRHTGSGPAEGHSSYVLSLEGYSANGLSPDINRLFREIPKTTNRIDAPEIYNTSNRAPYSFMLRRGHLGIVPGSETVMVDGQKLTRVSITPTLESQYFIDYQTGEIRLSRPVSGVTVTYQTQQEFPTNYKRVRVARSVPGDFDYPYYNVDTATVYFSADFPPGVPDYPIVVREVGLFDGSEQNPLTRMFSIVRSSEMVKDVNTGLRITWEIQLKKQEDAS